MEFKMAVNKTAIFLRFSGGRFPPARPQPPRRCASAGSSARAFPAGVAATSAQTSPFLFPRFTFFLQTLIIIQNVCFHCRFFVFLLFNLSSVDNGSLANSWSNWWDIWFLTACLSLKSLFNCFAIFLFLLKNSTSTYRIHPFFKDYVVKVLDKLFSFSKFL